MVPFQYQLKRALALLSQASSLVTPHLTISQFTINQQAVLCLVGKRRERSPSAYYIQQLSKRVVREWWRGRVRDPKSRIVWNMMPRRWTKWSVQSHTKPGSHSQPFPQSRKRAFSDSIKLSQCTHSTVHPPKGRVSTNREHKSCNSALLLGVFRACSQSAASKSHSGWCYWR